MNLVLIAFLIIIILTFCYIAYISFAGWWDEKKKRVNEIQYFTDDDELQFQDIEKTCPMN
jgi:cbb3-type cytochrome oxidase subunit 3